MDSLFFKRRTNWRAGNCANGCFSVLARIWSHPYNLIAHEREKERQRILKGEDEELQDFIDDDEDALTTSGN